MQTWLLVDATYLAWRAKHTTGDLSYHGEPTGVTFGVLRDLENLTELHGASRCILAFDYGGPGLRVEVYPNYKSSRKAMPPEKQEERSRLYAEIDRMKSKILPACGYRNIISIRGYEADDIIAKVAEDLPAGVDAVIVSADHDLFQCISERVVFYNPTSKKAVTFHSFREQWGIYPAEWPSVLALAGCSTDDIDGIDGIGEVYASKWVAGTLKSTSKAYQKISENLHVYNDNIKLVRLPYPGIELPALVDDEVTLARLDAVKDSLGIRAGRTAKSEAAGGLW